MASPKKDASPMERMVAYTDGYQQLALYALITGAVVIVASVFLNKLIADRAE
jgi:POT family proton-dependent oligopeptide transporter